MTEKKHGRCTAFDGNHRIASGTLVEVAKRVKEVIGRDDQKPILVFSDDDCEQIEIDFRGTVTDVVNRLEGDLPEETPGDKPRRAGRPRLGVVSREVTLLPRHWDWLNRQPSGASATIRKLVEEAKRSSAGKERKQRSQDAAFRFISVMAGNLPGFEEAIRALYAGNAKSFRDFMSEWPCDIRNYALELSESAFPKD